MILESWWVRGSRGYLTTCNGDFTIVVERGRWQVIKQELGDFGLTTVTMDGPSEGSLRLLRLPATEDECMLVRLSIRLHRAARPETADRLHHVKAEVPA
jgi:hypothetical protein